MTTPAHHLLPLSAAPALAPASRQDWLAISQTFLDHSYRQTWEYSRALAERNRATSEHVVIRHNGDIIGLAAVRIKKLPMLGGLAYISGGPLFRRGNPDDLENLSRCLAALTEEFATRRGMVLRIAAAPHWGETNASVIARFTAAGFSTTDRAAMYRTFLVDISPPLPQIRASLAQKWRNCLNKSERAGLTIREGVEQSLFDEFVGLFGHFKERKGFATELDAAFYAKLQSELQPAEALTIALAEQNGAVVAGHVSSMLGDTSIYLLGATNEAGLKCNAAYLLQWAAITRSKQHGMTVYDLGGIDPQANPGVYHFKLGLGGVDATAPGPFELSPNTIAAIVVGKIETMYRKAKKYKQSRASLAAIPAKQGGEGA